jgi:hypothetical protein
LTGATSSTSTQTTCGRARHGLCSLGALDLFELDEVKSRCPIRFTRSLRPDCGRAGPRRPRPSRNSACTWPVRNGGSGSLRIRAVENASASLPRVVRSGAGLLAGL